MSNINNTPKSCSDCDEAKGLCEFCETCFEVMRGDDGPDMKAKLQWLIAAHPEWSSKEYLKELYK